MEAHLSPARISIQQLAVLTKRYKRSQRRNGHHLHMELILLKAFWKSKERVTRLRVLFTQPTIHMCRASSLFQKILYYRQGHSQEDFNILMLKFQETAILLN